VALLADFMLIKYKSWFGMRWHIDCIIINSIREKEWVDNQLSCKLNSNLCLALAMNSL